MNAACNAVHAVGNAASTAFEERDEADAILLERCRAGEREAFGILLNRYRDRIVNLAFQLLGQRDDAEDVAQEAFTRAFASVASFRGESQFYTWLYRIAVNLCLTRKRRAKPVVSYEDEQAYQAASGPSQIETRLAVEQALQSLSEPLRAVLVLRELQGLSYEEIADILHLPLGTVRSRLHEARRRFREIWGKEEP